MHDWSDPLIQEKCRALIFTHCAVLYVPFGKYKMKEVARKVGVHMWSLPDDVHHWAFAARAATEWNYIPYVYFLAQFGIVEGDQSGVRAGVCSSEEFLHRTIKAFVGSQYEVFVRDSWHMTLADVRFDELVNKSSEWSKPYDLFACNCQDFAKFMLSAFTSPSNETDCSHKPRARRTC